MRWFTVEVHGTSRELYIVEAATAEEAAENWMSGDVSLVEIENCEVYSVTEDSE